MASINGVGIKNLRSLKNISNEIIISPITIIVGKNSAGKSTLARLFPLLRQSIEKRKRGPILWFGDYVDFGSFSQAVTRSEDEIELSLSIGDLKNHPENNRKLLGNYTSLDSLKMAFDDAKIKISLRQNTDGSTYAKSVSIKIDSTEVDIYFSPDGEFDFIKIDSVIYKSKDHNLQRIITEQGALLPKIRFASKTTHSGKDIWFYTENFWINDAVKFIHLRMHGNSTSKAAKKIYNSIELSDNKGTLKNIQSIVEPKSWVDYANYITIKSPDLKNLRNLLILSRIELIINKMDDILYECLIGVKYLKPLRATAERYYRRVDLAVSEIDPEGKNLPIFLDSLTQTQLTNFRNWLQENIGIDVKTEKESGQIILLAKTSTDTELVNVADMGFGISQILPFAAQLWASIYSGKNSFSNTAFLVVEQPELHLHPAFQAKIANLLAGVISINKSQKSKKPIKLIIETHSQHLINRLGSLIEDDIISESDVSIVIIEPDKENPGTSKTRISKFNSDGILENWPIGFFDSEE